MLKSELYRYRSEIEKICKETGIKKLMLFGSTLTGDSTTESDIDLLAEFEGTRSLFKVIGTKLKFEELLHNEIDLLTPMALSPYFRDKVLEMAEVIYEA